MNAEEILSRIHENVLQGRVDESDEGLEGDMEGQPGVTELTRMALEEGVDVSDVLDRGLSPAMEEVGRRYEEGEFLIPDMLASAECVSAAMDVLAPHLADSGAKARGRCVIATVEGDLHDIGKNIVATLLKGSGYEVHDLGTSVKADRIVEAVRERKPDFLGLSALLTSTMTNMKAVVEALETAGLRGDVRVLVGGAPLTPDFAEEIGADAYCRDAFDAIDTLERFEEGAGG